MADGVVCSGVLWCVSCGVVWCGAVNSVQAWFVCGNGVSPTLLRTRPLTSA